MEMTPNQLKNPSQFLKKKKGGCFGFEVFSISNTLDDIENLAVK